MEPIRLLSTGVLLLGFASGIYYAVSDNEAQGALVVLLGILYFVGIDRVLGK